MSDEFLLDLSTVVKRDRINLRSTRHPDGKAYELINADEFGTYEWESFQAHCAVISQYVNTKKKLTSAQEKQLRKALGDVLRMIIVGLESSALAEIEDIQRGKILGAWADKNLPQMGAAEGEADPSPSTTAGSSRGSRRSTAAARKAGSISRRGRSTPTSGA